MSHVDALSRNAVNANLIMDVDDWVLTAQLQDDALQIIINQLNNDDKNGLEKDDAFKNNRLYRKTPLGEKVVIPKSARWQIMIKYHDEIGHPGITKCITLIKDRFWFSGMTRFINIFV